MDINGITSVVTSSNTITTWSMSVIGASLLAILSTSYHKPIGKWSKLIYLLYIPGWIYLALSIKLGNDIVRGGIMATLDQSKIPEIVSNMNDEFSDQQHYFNLGLIFFGTWLLLYLSWWVLQDFISKSIES